MSDAVLVAVITGSVTIISIALARLSSHADIQRALQLLRHAQQQLRAQLTGLSDRLSQVEDRLPPRPADRRPH